MTRWHRVAMVFAHPAAHELLMAGLIYRHRANILFVTRGDSGSPGSDQLADRGLSSHPRVGSLNFLGMSEKESYQHAFAGNIDFYRRQRDQIVAWLEKIQPDALLGDSLELSNFHHDVTRVLIDSAVAIYRAKGYSIDNYEIAIACRIQDGFTNFLTQEFPDGSGTQIYRPNEDEREFKRQLTDCYIKSSLAVREVVRFFVSDREVYRKVPSNRNYLIAPPLLKRHYEEWGLVQVIAGKYERALYFEKHFVPIAEGLFADIGSYSCELRETHAA